MKDHPEQKNEIFSPYTVVRQNGEQLHAIKYSVAYRSFLEPAAKALREAAALSNDKDFAKFLRMRADALLSDDYYPSDLAWLDLKDPKIDVIFAPYETYMDGLLGVKASYGAAVLVRNEAESKKLDIFQQYVPDLQDALPLAPEDRPSKKGLQTSDGGGGLAVSCGRSAARLPGSCRQSAERSAGSRGEGIEEDFLQELHGRARHLYRAAASEAPDDSESGTEGNGRRILPGHAGA